MRTCGRGGATALAIDHVALTDPLDATAIEYLHRYDERGKPMSDHAGWCVTLNDRRESRRI